MSGATDRAAVEDFLYHEADLLDSWRLPEWVELFTEDGRYEVPAADLAADASPDNALFYIADDRFRIGERAARLMKKTGHSEYPHSKTRHLFTNVRLGEATGGGSFRATANFLCFRTKDAKTDMFWGKAYYELIADEGSGYRIRSKRCVLDVDDLITQGRITIIL